jgi:hypothetical protein
MIALDKFKNTLKAKLIYISPNDILISGNFETKNVDHHGVFAVKVYFLE